DPGGAERLQAASCVRRADARISAAGLRGVKNSGDWGWHNKGNVGQRGASYARLAFTAFRQLHFATPRRVRAAQGSAGGGPKRTGGARNGHLRCRGILSLLR